MGRVIAFTLLLLLSSQHDAQSAWDFAAPMITARMDAASAVVGDTLYVMGGRQTETGSGTGSQGFVDVVEAYVPLTDTWLTEYPPLPSPAALQASAVVGRRIYLLGGLAPERQTLDCIWHWEPGEPNWTEGPSLDTPVEGAAATTLREGNILLIGGLTASGEYMDEVLILFPDTAYGPEQAPDLDQARAAAGAVLMQDIVLVTGGYFYEPMGNCEIFAGTTWGIGPQLPYPTGSHIACATDTEAVVIGGQGQSGPLADVVRLTEAHGEWVEQGEPLSIPRARLAGGLVGGYFVAAGGMGPEGSTALNSVERLDFESVGRSPLEQPHPVQTFLRITLWPNPISTHFIATAELGDREAWEMFLHNAAGQRVWSTSGCSDRVRILACPGQKLPDGVYFITLSTTTRQTTTPVTILE